MVNLPIEGEDMVLEGGQDETLKREAYHELLLGRGWLPDRGLELGYDFGPPLGHLGGGDARLVASLGHPAAGHVSEAIHGELLAVIHDGQVQTHLCSVNFDVEVRLEPFLYNYLHTVINSHARVIFFEVQGTNYYFVCIIVIIFRTTFCKIRFGLGVPNMLLP